MAHPQQKAFCSTVMARFPHYFSGVLALDIGSLDLNGNNQYLFDANCLYLGIDVAAGRNVDIVSPGHQLGLPDETFDVIVSTECLEHDRHWEQTLQQAVRMLRPGGMLLMTCATTGRPEHGTRRTTPQDAPLLASVDDEWADYYRNLDEQDIRAALDVPALFQFIEFSVGAETHDLYCVAIKHGVFERRLDRSMQTASHPVRMQEADLRAQLQQVSEVLHRTQADLSSLIQGQSQYQDSQRQYTERLLELQEAAQLATMAASERNAQVAGMEQELAALRAGNVQATGELARLYSSTSWRITRPLRALGASVAAAGRTARRARHALGYVARGDFAGLRQRLRAKDADQN